MTQADLKNPRDLDQPDRRAARRGGRRAYDNRQKPWCMRRRLWLATASFTYFWWKRLRRRQSAEERV
jgi:hypothetical protein